MVRKHVGSVRGSLGAGEVDGPSSVVPTGPWSATGRPGSPRALPLQKVCPCWHQTRDLHEPTGLLVLTEMISE